MLGRVGSWVLAMVLVAMALVLIVAGHIRGGDVVLGLLAFAAGVVVGRAPPGQTPKP